MRAGNSGWWRVSLHDSGRGCRLAWPGGEELVGAGQFPRRVQVLAQCQGARLVQLPNGSFAVDGSDRAQFRKLEVVPVDEVGLWLVTMT